MVSESRDLPTISTEQARHLFLAQYQTIWGTHPAARTVRQNDPVAKIERQMWADVIDRVDPEDFGKLFAEVKGNMADTQRRGKPTLDDFKRSAARLHGVRTAFMERSPQYRPHEDREITRREYLMANEHRHQGSPTFAHFWQLEFGKKWGGYTPPANAQVVVDAPERVTPAEVDRALDPIEAEERRAMREEEPW